MTYFIRHLILPLFILTTLSTFAQTTKTKSKFWDHYPQRYHILSFSYGQLLPESPGTDGKVNLSYNSVYTNGAKESDVFTAGTKNILTGNIRTFGAVFESVFDSTNDVVVGYGGFKSDGGNGKFYINLGYRYVLDFGWIAIKPGVDLYVLSGTSYVGSIDNYGKDIWIGSQVAYAQFTTSTTQTYEDEDGNYYDEKVYYDIDADRLEFRYNRRATALQPVVQFSTHWKHLSVSLEAGYMAQIQQKNKLLLTQYAYNGASNSVGSIGMRKSGSISGPRLALQVGVLF